MPTEPELLRLFDRSPIGMYRSDSRGRLLVVNPAMVAMLGYDSVAEVLALDLTKDVYVDPEGRAPVLEEYRDTGLVEGRRVKWKTRTGRVLTVQLFGHVTDAKDGLVFDATVIDLTEIDALEDELCRRGELLEQTMQQVPAVYWTCDRDLRLTRVGGPTERLFGFPPEKFLGTLVAETLVQHKPSVDPIENHRRALAGLTTIYESEYEGKLVSITTSPFRCPRGQAIIGVLGTLVDVTAVRALERRMVDAQRAESLGVLAGGLAHDFNNLLVAVLGNADLALREIPRGHSGRGAIENIRTAGLRAAELTDQLLAYAGRGGAGTTRVEPAALVEELVRIARPQFREDLGITIDIPARLAVRADPTQLRQVLLNLITNARDAIATNGGEITILAETVHISEPHLDDVLALQVGSYIAIRVIDNGPGMDANTKRHMFEPFFTTKQSGNGLGLAAVLGIVRAHGGGIRVKSTPTDGTEITVLWPAAVTTPISAEAVSSPHARTILVIDDEALVRDVVARMVQDLGYAAMTAADGPSGLDLADQADAVLVDLTMPNMSGADVVAALRRKRPDLPVVICSGYERDSRGPIQADAYLPKPFRLEALERTLAKLLPLRSV